MTKGTKNKIKNSYVPANNTSCELAICHVTTATWIPFQNPLLWLIQQWSPIVFFCHYTLPCCTMWQNRELTSVFIQAPSSSHFILSHVKQFTNKVSYSWHMGMCYFNGLLFRKKSLNIVPFSTKISLNMGQLFIQNFTCKHTNGYLFLPKWQLFWGSRSRPPSKPNLGTLPGVILPDRKMV